MTRVLPHTSEVGGALSVAGLAEDGLHDAIIYPFPREEGIPLPLAETLPAADSRLRGTAKNVGDILLIHTRYSQARSDAPRREHQLLRVEVDNFPHRVWYTEPAEGGHPPITVVTKPGLGEIIENGVGWRVHRELAHALPQAHIISHATTGVGPTARLTEVTTADCGIDEMAEQALAFLTAVCRRQRVLYIGTSMGTVIGNSIQRLNLRRGQPVNFAGIINYEPALVVPENVGRDMGTRRFGTHFVGDALQEVFLRNSPSEILHLLRGAIASRTDANDQPAINRQIRDLRRGTPESEIEEVIEHYRVGVIAGMTDPVAQLPMWYGLRQKHPQRPLVIEAIKKRGHGMAVHVHKAVSKMVSTAHKMRVLPEEPATQKTA